jgi:hypothetical protein
MKMLLETHESYGGARFRLFERERDTGDAG